MCWWVGGLVSWWVGGLLGELVGGWGGELVGGWVIGWVAGGLVHCSPVHACMVMIWYHTRACMHVYGHALQLSCMHVRDHTIYMHACMYMDMDMHACMYMDMHACVYMDMHACMPTEAHFVSSVIIFIRSISILYSDCRPLIACGMG